jgi:hypothetical protein
MTETKETSAVLNQIEGLFKDLPDGSQLTLKEIEARLNSSVTKLQLEHLLAILSTPQKVGNGDEKAPARLKEQKGKRDEPIRYSRNKG